MIDGRWLWEQQRALVARHERRLGRALAEDLASEAAARCWRHPAPDGRHGPWLERIFRNLLVDHFRRRLPGDEPSAHPLVAPPSTPEDELLQNERRRAFARAWETVAPEQRAAIEARLTDQVNQFAQDRGLAPETIRTRIHRGLATLRQAVARVRVHAWLPSSLHAAATSTMPAAAALMLLTTTSSPQRTVAPTPTSIVVAQSKRPPRTEAVETRPAAAASDSTSGDDRRDRSSARRAVPPAPPSPTRFDFDTDELVGDLQRPDDLFLVGSAARGPRLAHRSADVFRAGDRTLTRGSVTVNVLGGTCAARWARRST